LAAAHHRGHFKYFHDVISTLVYFVLAYKFEFAFRFLESGGHCICAWSGA